MAKLTEEEKARRALNRRRKAASQAEKDAIRREQKQREWDANGTRLTWDEYVARVPCRGCGLPIIDGLEPWPAPVKMDDEQRKEYEAAEAEFRERHRDCRSHRWIQGRTTHCGFCCPPPPLSQKQIEEISAILTRNRSTTAPSELNTWRLTLTCDHAVERTQHRSHHYWSRSTIECPDCQQIRGVVTTERLPPDVARHDADKHQMANELIEAQAEHERLQKKADSARRRMHKLESQLADLDKAR
jgi:hypothetical protein